MLAPPPSFSPTMKLIQFPQRLKDLLEDSSLEGSINAFAQQVGVILKNNELPFFPGYTDHGVEHIHQVLATHVDLIPNEVWEANNLKHGPRLLTDIDAVVMIGATLLHDIAMLLQPSGFFELIREGTNFKPLNWFDQDHYEHSKDRPWPELWADYEREVRRFSDQQMGKILGEKMSQAGIDRLPTKDDILSDNDKLIIGEFIRRHHARLAHEIAIYGFPGLTPDEFGVLATKSNPLSDYADLIGLVARSHWMSMRTCQKYLTDSPKYTGAIRPMGAAVLYPMALLRVADYLQIDQGRAPAVLMQLKDPQSQVSIKEWKKHKTVRSIGPGRDPNSTSIIVDNEIEFELYLSIKQLLDGLQDEMDHSTSVLEEVYGNRMDLRLNMLRLKTRRVQSNLYEMSFQNALPYVPRPTGYSSDPRILSLLVEPLYGKYPNVGVRELIQNSVDAVRELQAWREKHDTRIAPEDQPQQDADVLVDFIKEENDGKWILKVTDKGIGMTSKTIENYFLRAGASFRNSPEWSKEFLNEDGQSQVARTGKFGIGVFAIFLLGDRFRVETRHVSEKSDDGYIVQADRYDSLIQIKKLTGSPIGTTIWVELSDDAIDSLELETNAKKWAPEQFLDWYCWDAPIVRIKKSNGKSVIDLIRKELCPISTEQLPPHWSKIDLNGNNEVYWRFDKSGGVSCNGIEIRHPEGDRLLKRSFAPLNKLKPETSGLRILDPEIAVVDRTGLLPITTQRYGLNGGLPFRDEIEKDIHLSLIAYSLIEGPTSTAMAVYPPSYPLLINPIFFEVCTSYPWLAYLSSSITGDSRNRWWFTSKGFCLSANGLFHLLSAESIYSHGIMTRDFPYIDTNTNLKLPACDFLCDNNAMESIDLFSLKASIDPDTSKSGKKHASLFKSKQNSVIWYADQISESLSSKNQWLVSVFTPSYSKECNEHESCYQKENAEQEKIAIKMAAVLKNLEEGVLGNRILGYACIKSRPQGARINESVFSNLWQECLGKNLIPFNQPDRNALIEKARQHPELKIHIDKWMQMRKKK